MDLNGVLQLIDSGSWLSLSTVKCNATKNVAGEILHLKRCRLARRQPATTTTTPTKLHGVSHLGTPLGDGGRRNPHHAWNFTRNIETPSGQVITIHPLFVFTINNQPVL